MSSKGLHLQLFQALLLLVPLWLMQDWGAVLKAPSFQGMWPWQPGLLPISITPHRAKSFLHFISLGKLSIFQKERY